MWVDIGFEGFGFLLIFLDKIAKNVAYVIFLMNSDGICYN